MIRRLSDEILVSFMGQAWACTGTYDPSIGHDVLPQRTGVGVKMIEERVEVMYRMVRLRVDFQEMS